MGKKSRNGSDPREIPNYDRFVPLNGARAESGDHFQFEFHICWPDEVLQEVRQPPNNAVEVRADVAIGTEKVRPAPK